MSPDFQFTSLQNSRFHSFIMKELFLEAGVRQTTKSSCYHLQTGSSYTSCCTKAYFSRMKITQRCCPSLKAIIHTGTSKHSEQAHCDNKEDCKLLDTKNCVISFYRQLDVDLTCNLQNKCLCDCGMTSCSNVITFIHSCKIVPQFPSCRKTRNRLTSMKI